MKLLGSTLPFHLAGPVGLILLWLIIQKQRLLSLFNIWVLRRTPEVLVVSTGGVATTALISEISKYKKVNSAGDADGLKHMPSARLLPKIPTVFLIGHLSEILSSLERRGYAGTQLIKLCGPLALLQVIVSSESQRRSLLKRKIQKQIEKHQGSRKVSLVVQYEDLWQELDLIRLHLNLPEDFAANFPPFRGRNEGAT